MLQEVALIVVSTSLLAGNGSSIAPSQHEQLQPYDLSQLPDSARIESLNPLRVRIPSDYLIPEIAKQLPDLSQQPDRTNKISCGSPSIVFGSGVVEVKTSCKAWTRGCTKIFGDWKCTAWVGFPVNARAISSLSINNWIVSAKREQTHIDSPNALGNTLINWFHGNLYGKLDSKIDTALNNYNGMNLKSRVEAAANQNLGSDLVLNASIDPGGVVFEAK